MQPAALHELFKREAFIPLLTNSKRPQNTKSYDRHRTLSKKQQKQWKKSLKLYRANREEFEKDERDEEEKVTILAYWSFVDPYIEQLTENCGGCWYTNDRNFEKTADAIVFDNTRSTTAKNDGDMPDFSSRNLDSQYWIWWPRESAAKGLNRKTKFNLVKDENNWDGCMNLTLSYRQDSDIVRPFGTIDRVFEEQYFITDDLRGKELMGKGQRGNNFLKIFQFFGIFQK